MDDEGDTRKILDQLAKISRNMERLGIAEYVEMLHNPRRLFWSNFLAGLSRGLGTAVGFTLLGALVIYLLNRLVMLNLPVISDFLAQLVEMVIERTFY